MRFFVHTVAPGQLSLRVISFSLVSIIPPKHHNYLRLRDALKTERQAFEALESPGKAALFHILATLKRKVFLISSVVFHARIYCLAHRELLRFNT